VQNIGNKFELAPKTNAVKEAPGHVPKPEISWKKMTILMKSFEKLLRKRYGVCDYATKMRFEPSCVLKRKA
jgi:hypothetical protein